MKAETKRLSMSIEYGDRNGLDKALKHFMNAVKNNRTNHERVTVCEALLEWENGIISLPNHRVENNDGVKYVIIESKMNEI